MTTIWTENNSYGEENTRKVKAKESRWDNDQAEISRIQFHSDLTQEEKNKRISEIERRMEQEEQKELDGKGTGYYESLQIKAIESGALEVKPRPMGAESTCPTCKGTGMRVVDSLRLTDDDPENLGDVPAGYRGASMKPTHYLPCTTCNQVGYIMNADDTIDEQTEAWGHNRPDIDDIIAEDPFHNLGGQQQFSPYNQHILQGKIGEQDPDEMGHPIDPPMYAPAKEQIPVYGEDDLNELRTGMLDDLGNYHREALGDKQDHDNPEKQKFLKRLKNTPDMEGAQWLFGLIDDEGKSTGEAKAIEQGDDYEWEEDYSKFGDYDQYDQDDEFIDGSDVPRHGHYESKAKEMGRVSDSWNNATPEQKKSIIQQLEDSVGSDSIGYGNADDEYDDQPFDFQEMLKMVDFNYLLSNDQMGLNHARDRARWEQAESKAKEYDDDDYFEYDDDGTKLNPIQYDEEYIDGSDVPTHGHYESKAKEDWDDDSGEDSSYEDSIYTNVPGGDMLYPSSDSRNWYKKGGQWHVIGDVPEDMDELVD